MNPRAEAEQRLGRRYDARVLEPSPPAVTEPPWFADDPVARGDAVSGRLVVAPVSTGDVRWEQLAADDPDLAAWCAERWLGPYPRLGAAPPSLEPTRRALHRLAEQVIAPARQRVNSKIGLRYTRGGFGTPFFGNDVQVRVEGTELVVEDDGELRRAPITSLRAAAEMIGGDFVVEDDELLTIDPGAARFLGDWYGFAASVLEQLRAEASADHDPSRVQLWPEHFDLALELGSEDAGHRAAYGCSPGDDQHPEPYVYVVPWVAPAPGELWQASGFAGAELPLARLLGATDQLGTALAFFRARVAALNSADS